ncbi:MAG TPA: low affinity iron permease family protein [Pseudolabrys sp.]|nr:low affinity iron permease family protein [Pseudolabrys sp.]
MAQTATHNGHLASNLNGRFARFAQGIARWSGHPAAFLLAAFIVLAWIVTGPVFDYSDTWQLVINTGTTIITFLMVFLIQNTQNRDTMALQLKLSELVLAMKGAQNKFAAVEDLSDEELEELHQECKKRAEFALDHLQRRRDTHAVPNPKTRAAAQQASAAIRRSARQR